MCRKYYIIFHRLDEDFLFSATHRTLHQKAEYVHEVSSSALTPAPCATDITPSLRLSVSNLLVCQIVRANPP